MHETDSEAKTALYLAASYGFMQCVKVLLDHKGVDITVNDNKGRGPYEAAFERKQHGTRYKEIAALLTERGGKAPVIK